MMRNAAILILSVMLFSGCNPYLFELNLYNRDDYISVVENLSRFGAVEKYADNAFMMHSDALAAIKTPSITLSASDMTLRYGSDNTGDYTIYFRTSAHSMSTGKYVEMKVRYEESTVYFEDKESGIKKVVPVDIDLEQGNRLFALNDGKYLKIYWDCDEIYNYKTNIPSTEYIIIRTENNCSLEVEAWEVKYLYEDARYLRLPVYDIFLE